MAAATPESNQIEATLVRECFTDIESRPVLWLWRDRIPRSKLSIFSGNPDCGKTTVLCDFIARYTTGADYPDGAPGTEPGSVLMLNAEDDPGDTLKPRLIAAGADLSKVSYLKAVQISQGARKREQMLALDTDLSALESELVANPSIGVVSIDPITSYVGRADLNREQELRRVLVPIKELAERLDVTFIGLGHFSKRADVSALHRVGGAVAMTGVARSVWLFAKNPDVPGEYLMLLGKGNLTRKRTGLRYSFAEKELPTGGTPFISWGGDAEGDADSVLAASPDARRADKAAKFLTGFLAGGQQSSEDVLNEGRKLGISRNALFEAKKEIGIRAERLGTRWFWSAA